MAGIARNAMHLLVVGLLSVSVVLSASLIKTQEYPTEEVTVRRPNEKWGYVAVRPEAHMFWWLYSSTSPKGPANVPLVLWLQGGPGGSGSGFGNFGEIGPLDVQLKPRNTTWLSAVSLLFIDNPVGTGYSYVDSDKAYTTDVEQIANDLLRTFQVFMNVNSEFSSVPFYIFSESYGGKMAAAFSQVLHKAVQTGVIKCKFEGFAMGDSWISPVDSTFSWAPYLYVNSLIDRSQLEKLNKTANKIAELTAAGQWTQATNEWSALENQIESYTAGVNFYNIQKWGSSERKSNSLLFAKESLTSFERAFERQVGVYQEDSLAALMNGPIRKALGCIPDNVTWGGQAGMVFTKQQEDFMKPVSDIVDDMIVNTSLKVVVYSAQLDLIVANLGTEAWVYRLKIADQFSRAKKEPMEIDGIPQAFTKTADNFQYYYILAAGHMVPADNGPAALMVLKRIVGA